MPLKPVKVSQEELVSRVRYEDGNLYWLKSGKKAGCFKRGDGYGCIRVNKKLILLHRAIWIYHNGEIPEGMDIDHVDGDRANNRIENIRLASRSQNLMNKGARRDNKAGVKHVRWNEPTKSWRVKMNIGGKHLHLGLFKTLEEATAVACAAREKYHGAFANHGQTMGGSHSY
jgi:hypothetical protein